MAGRRRKRKGPPGTNIEDLRPETHRKAWNMLSSGLRPEQIKRELGLTNSQWQWMLHKGDDNKPIHDKLGMPSFRRMFIDQVIELRSAARDAGRHLAVGSVAAFEAIVANAQAAGQILNHMLIVMAHEFGIDSEEPIGSMASLNVKVPTRDFLDTIRVLKTLTDLRPAADAYMKLHGDTASSRAERPDLEPRGRVSISTGTEAPSHPALPASSGGDADPVVIDFVTQLQQWTPEQLQRYVEGGPEPEPDELDHGQEVDQAR